MKQTPIYAHFTSKKHVSRKRKLQDSEAQEQEAPPPVVPELSDKTKELLAALQSKRPARPPTDVNEILHSVPAQEKYKDILKPGRQLGLPVHYNQLLNKFEATDLALSYLKRRKVVRSFQAVQKDVEALHKHKFTLVDLQKMLTVFPDCYVLAWVCNPEPLLILDLPQSDVDFEARKQEFKAKLLEIVRQKHSLFLKSLPSRPQVDPANHNVWHHAFDLHGLPDIEPTPLPPKPQVHSNTIEEPEVQRVEAVEPVPTDSKFSPALMAKIQAQAAASRGRKNELATDEKTLRCERLLNLAEVLKAIYATKNEPSCFLSDLIRRIKSSPKCFSSEEQLEEDIKALVLCFPEWLTEVKTRSGQVLRMNKKQEVFYSQLKATLQAKL
mmetsp:Transcript_27609/g.49804  ORF Transcript_27609/g.49804 Transcript_27609/m.49804 type:complete len:383 (-) Transcript_27609:1809-2957(-)